MANNRMAIVCRRCKVGTPIAKYYPLTHKEDYEPGMLLIGGVDSPDNMGWYTNDNKDLYIQLDEFFLRHKHKYDFSNSSGHQYYLSYEDKGKWEYEK